jgi:hypothetical protein
VPKQDNKLKMIKLKGYIGYVREGFKGIAKNYDKIKWGEGTIKPSEIKETPFKTTIKF